jgi:hypothetical protein
MAFCSSGGQCFFTIIFILIPHNHYRMILYLSRLLSSTAKINKMIFRVASSALILNAASAYVVDYGDMNLVSFIEFPTTRVIDKTFTSRSCAVKELSVGNELCPYDSQYPTRKLLRFSTGVWNQGPNDLIIPPDAKNNATLYDFGDCHKHYHFK